MTEPRTPQRLNGKRVTFGARNRRIAVGSELATHRVILQAHLAAGVLPRAADLVTIAEQDLGKPYALSGCRCSPGSCYARDCSGEVYRSLNVLMGTNLCGSSFSLAAIARDYGTEIPEQEAIWTPGAIGIRCPFCDPNFNGSNGHVVIFVGDGETTVEEGGHATGCYHGHATGRGFSLWMQYPGLDYSAVSSVAGEIDMFAQTHHYGPHGEIIGPTTLPKGYEAEYPIVRVADDGSCIEAKFGASIDSDQPADVNHPMVLRRWYPARPLPAGARFTGVAFREGTSAEPIPGGVAVVTDGSTRKFRLS